MDFWEFVDEIKARLIHYFGPEYIISTKTIVKVNDVELEGLTISDGKSNIEPCIYLDAFYDQMYRGEITIEDVSKEIIDIYKRHVVKEKVDISVLMDFDQVRRRIKGKLVNAGRNERAIANSPYRKVLDLALTYYIELPFIGLGENASTKITNQLMNAWNVSEEQLYQQMQENMQMEEGTITNIVDVLMEMIGERMIDQGNSQMYVMTNKAKVNGAVEILNKEMLKRAEEIIGDSFYILPSSVHETLILPVGTEEMSPDELVSIVESVNNNEVSESEVLSNHIYFYSHETGNLEIAA